MCYNEAQFDRDLREGRIIAVVDDTAGEQCLWVSASKAESMAAQGLAKFREQAEGDVILKVLVVDRAELRRRGKEREGKWLRHHPPLSPAERARRKAIAEGSSSGDVVNIVSES